MTREFSDSPPGQLEEILVHDVPEPCPYLPKETARMPLRLQFQRNPDRFDALLAQGNRRVGPLMYKTECATCSACESLRVPVAEFVLTRSHRRIRNKNKDLRLEVTTPPPSSRDRVALFNRHRLERNLSKKKLGSQGYEAWLSQTWTETREFAWFLGDELVMSSIVDAGKESTSAVYCYFKPELHARSLGTYAILHAIAWAQENEFRFHYLGLYVAENPHLSYKSRFLPHHRLIKDQWESFPQKTDAD